MLLESKLPKEFKWSLAFVSNMTHVVKREAPPTGSDELTASEVAHSLEWRKGAAGSNPRMSSSSDSSLNLAANHVSLGQPSARHLGAQTHNCFYYLDPNTVNKLPLAVRSFLGVSVLLGSS